MVYMFVCVLFSPAKRQRFHLLRCVVLVLFELSDRAQAISPSLFQIAYILIEETSVK